MKTIITTLAIVTAITLGGANARAQTPDKMEQMDPKAHRELMPVHAMLLGEQKQQDAEIEKLLAEVKAATGEKRVDAIIAVLDKLVEQRREMQGKIAARLDR